MAHPDPDRLIQEFVARDARGEFTHPNRWFERAVACPAGKPNSAPIIMVRGYRIAIVQRTPDSVRAAVTWDQVGYGGYSADALDPGTDHDTLVAVRTSFGWCIASRVPHAHEMISPPSRP